MNVVIIGARDREESTKDELKVQQILDDLRTTHGQRLDVISAGCDKGIGKYVKSHCERDPRIRFIEIRASFHGSDFKRMTFTQVFSARNAALKELGDEFHLFLDSSSNSGKGIIDALVTMSRTKVGDSRVTTYPL